MSILHSRIGNYLYRLYNDGLQYYLISTPIIIFDIITYEFTFTSVTVTILPLFQNRSPNAISKTV